MLLLTRQLLRQRPNLHQRMYQCCDARLRCRCADLQVQPRPRPCCWRCALETGRASGTGGGRFLLGWYFGYQALLRQQRLCRTQQE